MKQGTVTRGSFDPDRIRAIQEALPKQPRDDEKRLNYFMKPEGRRLVEYEQLTGYAQQSADFAGGGLEIGDYMQKHAGGRGAYANETTELKTHDWFRFRDPERAWFYPMVKNKSEDGRTAVRFLEASAAEGRFRTIAPDWLEFLEVELGVLTHYEYGLFNAHSSVVKDALSDFVKNWAAIAAFHKNDASQMVQYERVMLSKLVDGFAADLTRSKEMWTTNADYSEMRASVEELWGETYDWCEILWAVHCVIDPIVGQFIRREFWQTASPFYGDSVTPWILSQACGYHQSTKKGALALFGGCLAADPNFGTLNEAFLGAWTEKWLPRAIASLKGFMGVYARVPAPGGSFAEATAVEAAVHRVIADWAHDFAPIPAVAISTDDLVGEVMAGFQRSA